MSKRTWDPCYAITGSATQASSTSTRWEMWVGSRCISPGTSYGRITFPSYDDGHVRFCQVRRHQRPLRSLPARQENYAADFYPCRFFASAWHNTPSQMQHPSHASLRDEHSEELSQLRQGLPTQRWTILSRSSRTSLKTLAAGAQPHRPPGEQHPCEHRNGPHDGHLRLERQYTAISPFGMSLRALETMLGIRTVKESRRYYVN